jgi:acetyl esterase/lipase
MRPRKLIGQVLLRSFLKVDDPTRIEPWQALLAQNTVGPLPVAIPIFVAQGMADDTVDPPVTASYVKQLCAKGSSVRIVLLPGVGHGMVAHDSAGAAVDWMTDRFANTPASNDCDKR